MNFFFGEPVYVKPQPITDTGPLLAAARNSHNTYMNPNYLPLGSLPSKILGGLVMTGTARLLGWDYKAAARYSAIHTASTVAFGGLAKYGMQFLTTQFTAGEPPTVYSAILSDKYWLLDAMNIFSSASMGLCSYMLSTLLADELLEPRDAAHLEQLQRQIADDIDGEVVGVRHRGDMDRQTVFVHIRGHNRFYQGIHRLWADDKLHTLTFTQTAVLTAVNMGVQYVAQRYFPEVFSGWTAAVI